MKKFKTQKRGGKNPRKGGSGLAEKIFQLFQRDSRKRYHTKQIAKKLKLKVPYSEIDHILQELAKRGKIKASGEGKFKLAKKGKQEEKSKSSGQEIIGRLDMTKNGDGFVIVDGMDDDIFVQGRHLRFALNGDQVKVELKRGSGRRLAGVVTEVVERKREKFLGKLKIEDNVGFVDSEDARLFITIQINSKKFNGAKNNDVVMVNVTKWPENRNKFPKGEVQYVLGEVGSNEMEMQQILLNQGFDPSFSNEILAEADAYEDGALEGPSKDRKDLRNITTFTIDPDTAKDFDDALSYQSLGGGNYEVGIHIADVTHYIQPGTLLDKEAYTRSTSVYLVDRVAPMLPERLSNELCSLRPNEDKCTFSAVFTFDKNDQITNKWFGKTLTHSDRRFTYEEAQELIEGKKGKFSREVNKLNRLAEKMRRERFKNGAINFESDEVKFKLAEDGTPLEVYIKERFAAHMLVEEFMLLANKEVANFIVDKSKDQSEIPYVYRVHDLPDPDKVEDFSRFAFELGIKMDTSSAKSIAKSFNMLQKASEGNSALRMLGPMAIRTMAKAIYTSNNIGHYGLGFDNYAHFTSPIRRYADVLVHRILHKNLRGTYRIDKGMLESMCQHISAQEKKAAEAERESVKFKLVEFMETRVGQIFDGFITGMIDRGFFVELAGVKAEGLVGFEQLDEPYYLEDNRLKAVAKRSGKTLKMGDKVKVKVVATNLSARQIDLEWVPMEDAK